MILKCPNEFGIYDNSIYLEFPPYMRFENGGFYSSKDGCLIDICVVDEIKYLWEQGIHTYGSCCGHGKTNPSVCVHEKDFAKMEKLGYKKDVNERKNYIYKLKSEHTDKHLLEKIL